MELLVVFFIVSSLFGLIENIVVDRRDRPRHQDSFFYQHFRSGVGAHSRENHHPFFSSSPSTSTSLSSREYFFGSDDDSSTSAEGSDESSESYRENSENSLGLQNMEESAGEFEGDIILLAGNGISPRNGNTQSSRRWPKSKKGRVNVPYVISSTYTSEERDKITSAFEDFHSQTCIRMVPRTSQSDYIEVVNNRGCASHVGRSGGRQIVSLGVTRRGSCLNRGTIVHEILHALGFWHMQSSPDRDKYVKINYKNILPGNEFNFQKYTSDRYGTAYDLGSVMHYGPYAFSRNGQPTIEARDRGMQGRMGQRGGMSSGDVRRLNILYKC